MIDHLHFHQYLYLVVLPQRSSHIIPHIIDAWFFNVEGSRRTKREGWLSDNFQSTTTLHDFVIKKTRNGSSGPNSPLSRSPISGQLQHHTMTQQGKKPLPSLRICWRFDVFEITNKEVSNHQTHYIIYDDDNYLLITVLGTHVKSVVCMFCSSSNMIGSRSTTIGKIMHNYTVHIT